MKNFIFRITLKGLIPLSIFFLQFLVIPHSVSAQGVGVNATGATPNAAAGLDVDFADKGMLVPRMTESQRNAISSPPTSLLIYQTDNTPGYYYNSGNPSSPSWIQLITSVSSGWLVTGNSGTTPGTQYIGTTDAKDLVFKTNNTEWMKILSTGNVGIRTNVGDGSKIAFSVNDNAGNTKLMIRSDGHIGINGNDSESGLIDCNASGSNEGYRLTNDSAHNSIRLWLASTDGSDGDFGLAYLTRGGTAIAGICIDDNGIDGRYGAVGICLEDIGYNSTPPPNSTLQVNGSFSARINQVSADDTLTNRDYFVKVVTGGANKTMTLPPASSCAGRTYFIKKVDASPGNVIIAPNGTETIDDESGFTISGQYATLSIISDGLNWLIMNH